MCFIDFASIPQASAAMRQYQGHTFDQPGSGIVIDYDKDDRSKRDKQYEKSQYVTISM